MGAERFFPEERPVHAMTVSGFGMDRHQVSNRQFATFLGLLLGTQRRGGKRWHKKPFKGVIKLDVRDSVPDWGPYTPTKAPAGAPNILFVLYDDTGLAAWSPFGGRINMPTLQKLADRGLMYSQWHTTALCSPTRSTLLTGRNHHLNGMAAITEGANGFPGRARPHLRTQCATIGADSPGRRLEHLLARQEPQRPRDRTSPRARAASSGRCNKGFDRFYGFLGGETNQWYPDLVEDNQFIDQPYQPGGGLSPLQGSGRQGHRG